MYKFTEPVNEIIPAHLGILAIYNPSLGSTDESIENQIIYYSSFNSTDHGKRKVGKEKYRDGNFLRHEKNEQLRQVGLAQGIVEFGKNFSGGKAVETIDTEKSRIILKEFEPGWWILASVNLSILPKKTSTATCSEQNSIVEYSSRDVKPAEVLLNDLLRAHSIFLLHHAPSINELFEKTKRPRFLSILRRYWDAFASRWNVLMHGNPANSLYPGIKIAPCGELGIGVGEENRGSAEREVLEGLGHQVEGMVDVIVSKFGDEATSDTSFSEEDTFKKSWIGQGNEPSANDGAIFLGTGALSRTSLRDLYYWIEDLYRWGIYTYGIIDDPSLQRRSKRLRKEKASVIHKSSKSSAEDVQKISDFKPQPKGIGLINQDVAVQEPVMLHPTVSQSSESLDHKKHLRVKSHYNRASSVRSSSNSGSNKRTDLADYFKFGYKTLWSLSGNWSKNELEKADSNDNSSSIFSLSLSDPEDNPVAAKIASKKSSYLNGRFLIGLTGDLEDNIQPGPRKLSEGQWVGPGTRVDDSNISLRRLTLALDDDDDISTEAGDEIPSRESQYNKSPCQNSVGPRSCKKFESLQVVVYTSKPFIFIFLFASDGCALASSDFYYSLQHKLQPILNPLVTFAKSSASRPQVTRDDSSDSQIFDLIWDPRNLTISSTIPNIPDISQIHPPTSESFLWSVLEALNTHMQITKTFIASRDSSELERVCKTSRGWWIFWTKIPEPKLNQCQLMPSRLISKPIDFSTEDTADVSSMASKTSKTCKKSPHIQGTPSDCRLIQEFILADHDLSSTKKEIFLIRRKSDGVPARSMSRRSIASTTVGSEKIWANEPSTLAREIGIDTKSYVESLLNLSQ